MGRPEVHTANGGEGDGVRFGEFFGAFDEFFEGGACGGDVVGDGGSSANDGVGP